MGPRLPAPITGAFPGTLARAQGEMVKTLTIPILYDELEEPEKTFRLTLSNPKGSLALRSRATATITILDTTGTQPHPLTWAPETATARRSRREVAP
jgi:hypothetical protein